MAWTNKTPLPFFVFILYHGSAAVVIHPVYHSKAINRDVLPFPHDEWGKNVEESIEESIKAVPRKGHRQKETESASARGVHQECKLKTS